MTTKQRPVIYQLLPRLFSNTCAAPTPGGPITANGCGKLNGITDDAIAYIKSLGCNHIWLTGVLEHSHDADYTRYGIARNNPHVVKGRAGSPYAITDYYDIDPDLAEDVPHRIDEFEACVKRIHRKGMKVVIDFVPNHVAREYHSDAAPRGVEDFGVGDNEDMFFSPSNNFYYIPRQKFSPSVDMGSGSEAYLEFPAKATGNDCYTAFPGACDWYDTVKLNYGVDPANGSKHFRPVPPTWLKMLNILRYWAAKGVDAFRCDMVHMVPVEFWHWAIANVRAHYPHLLFIAEIYDVALYRPYIFDGGFDYLYDKVTLYDTLRAIETGNVSAACLTSCWQTVEGIAGHMLNFLENHDEQRFASAQYAGDARRALPSLVVSATIGTGAMMVYFGQEIGEPAADAEGYSGHDGRTTIFDYWSIEKVRRLYNGGTCDGPLTPEEAALVEQYRSVLQLVNTEDAVREGAFFDLMYVNYDNPRFNPHRQYAYLRQGSDATLLIAVNFDSAPADIEVRVPQHAFDVLGTAPRRARATELLNGARATVDFTADAPVALTLAAHGAAVWRIPRGKAKKA
ncbi:MAG: alpha-amylase family protein [Muribaculaceae bacterium]|nr:alpha-amylase family protein [Muribaculaceae bacterium]